jgi:hypothetical protein
LRNLKIKTTIKKDTTLNFLVWHKNGMREAFLMHMTAVLDAIKKRGHFYNYKKAEKVHKEACHRLLGYQAKKNKYMSCCL